MKRPKPFFRKQTQSRYVQIGKKQINLGKNEAEAWDQYHRIMVQRESIDVPDDSICNLLNRYLDWLKSHRSEATFTKCRLHLRRFAKYIGQQKRISQLKKHHIQAWVDRDYDGKSSTYQHTAISTVVAALNWSVSMDFIERNPIANFQKPTRKVREFFVPPEQWADLLSAIKDRELGDLVTFMLTTGARPQEARHLEARHYENGRLVFSRYESKGQQRQRVIYLDATSKEIIERRIAMNPEGPIFRNSRRNPWTKDAINCRFQRLKVKLNMPELCAYTCRHSFAHWKLSSGTEAHVVAKLMGHVDSRMIETRYGHLEKNVEFMQAQTSDPAPIPPLDVLPGISPGIAADHLG